MTPEPKPAEKLLTVEEVAAETKMAVVTIRRHIAKGALPVVRVGPYRRIRITRAALLAYIGPVPS